VATVTAAPAAAAAVVGRRVRGRPVAGRRVGRGQHHGAVRHAQRPRHAPREQVVDLVGREVAGDLVEDVDELAAVLGVGAGPRQLLLGAAQRLARGAQRGPGAQVRLHARHELARAHGLAHEVGGAEAQRAHRVLLRGRRREHQHRHVAPPLVALGAL
jgi:hypothetical protein